MIDRKTLFILGAGASKPYGYPTSKELYNDIIDVALDDDFKRIYMFRDEPSQVLDDHRDFKHFGGIDSEINEFRRKLRYAKFESIDYFLEHNPDYKDLGKMLIAKILIQFEDMGYFSKADNDWYNYLFNQFMKASFDELKHNKVNFLSFNYDRSLEQFLFTKIKNGYSKNGSDVASVLRNFKFLHVYGSLGDLPWQYTEGFEYSSSSKIDRRLKSAISSIYVIGEERNPPKFEIANDMISQASEFCFLGFGYDSTNLKRLNISKMQGKNVYGSCYNMEKAEIKAIQNYFMESSVSIIMGDKDDDSLMFLRKNYSRKI